MKEVINEKDNDELLGGLSIGVAFMLSSISGLVFLLPGDPTSRTLGISNLY
jgi:hypothetical protein